MENNKNKKETPEKKSAKNYTLEKALLLYVTQKNVIKTRSVASELHPKDLYELTSEWSIDKLLILVRLLESDESAELFDEFPTDIQEEMIKSFSDNEVANLFEELYTDEIVDILDDLPTSLKTRVLESVNEETRKNINTIFRFKPGEIGYHLSLDVVSIKIGLNLKKAKTSIKKSIKDKKEIAGVVYVVDKDNKFLGYVTPSELFLNEDETRIETFLNKISPLKTSSSMDEARQFIKDYDLPSVPVVDSKNNFIGAINSDEIIEILDELSSSFTEMATVKHQMKPYMEQSNWEIFKSRIWWITLLIVIGSITQFILMGFQAAWSLTDYWTLDFLYGGIALSTVVALAFTSAISISSSINDASGNTGAQSSATLIRALALDEIREDQYGKAIAKEVKVGIYIGAFAAVNALIRTYVIWAIFGIFNGVTDGEVHLWIFLIAAVASISFFVAIIFGNWIGAWLPILAQKRKWDGAVISGPVQTTLVDIFTFAFYLGLTTAIFLPLALNGAFPAPEVSVTPDIISNTMNALNNIDFNSFRST